MSSKKAKLSFLWKVPLGPVPEITPDELYQWLSSGKRFILLDSRTALEFTRGTLPGARHAPVIGLPESIDRYQMDGSEPIVLLCLSGHRSRPGTRLLRSRGREAYSLKGGLLAWRQRGYDIKLLG